MDSVIATLSLQASASGNPVAILRGATSQTANLQEWQNDAGTVQARVTSGGSIVTTQGFAVLGGASISGSIAALFQSAAASRIPVVIQGAASQTADTLQIQDSSGTTLTAFNSIGFLKIGTPIGGVIAVNNSVASNRPLVIQGAASQSANLTEWLNSAGTVLARIDSGGNFRGNILQTIGAGADLREGSGGGGLVTLIKMGAAATNPGASLGRIYFRDGTTAGTLKLVVRAGAAGAETTILDNIPQ
jgi:hypothetical protein